MYMGVCFLVHVHLLYVFLSARVHIVCVSSLLCICLLCAYVSDYLCMSVFVGVWVCVYMYVCVCMCMCVCVCILHSTANCLHLLTGGPS